MPFLRTERRMMGFPVNPSTSRLEVKELAKLKEKIRIHLEGVKPGRHSGKSFNAAICLRRSDLRPLVNQLKKAGWHVTLDKQYKGGMYNWSLFIKA